MFIKLYKHFMGDPLYRNSIYIMASTFIMAVLGFFFWIVIARLFPPDHVGIATALISAMTLLSSFSFLGFNTSLIRYLPKSDNKNDKINSVFILVILASIVASLVFVGGLIIFSPKLLFLQTHFLYIVTFALFVIGATINSIIDSIFMAYRASGNILIKNTIMSVLKLIFPLVFIFMGSYGIFASVALSTLISSLIGLGILFFKYNYQPELSFNKNVIKQMAAFSGGNYIAGFLTLAPIQILPILIINKLNAETAAYYYVASMILGFLTVISSATTHSLLAEGSYDIKRLKVHFIKASKIIALFLVPAILLTFLFGNLILNAFGKNYSDGAFTFLQIISVSSLFMSISALANAVLRVRHQIKALIVTNAVGAILILGLSYAFIPQGLVGVGWGWLLGQALLSLIYVILLRKEIFPRNRILLSFVKTLPLKAKLHNYGLMGKNLES